MTEKTPMEQWMRDTVERMGFQLNDMQTSLTDVRERLIRIESSPHSAQVERNANEIARLWAQIDAMKAKQAKLELDQAQNVASAKGWERSLDWVYKLAPWAALIVVAIAGKFSIAL